MKHEVVLTARAPAGRLIFVGITTGEVPFRHPMFHKPEGTLLCTRDALPRDFTRIIQLIEERRLDTTPWITHRMALDAWRAPSPATSRRSRESSRRCATACP